MELISFFNIFDLTIISLIAFIYAKPNVVGTILSKTPQAYQPYVVSKGYAYFLIVGTIMLFIAMAIIEGSIQPIANYVKVITFATLISFGLKRSIKMMKSGKVSESTKTQKFMKITYTPVKILLYVIIAVLSLSFLLLVGAVLYGLFAPK